MWPIRYRRFEILRYRRLVSGGLKPAVAMYRYAQTVPNGWAAATLELRREYAPGPPIHGFHLMTLSIHSTLLGAVLLGLLAHPPARAEDYPVRPVTIVVSLAPGSGMDTITRLYADKLSEALGKPVIVENKPGAATTLAANQVASARPDGYTLVVLTAIAMSINPTLYRHLNYDPQELTPISLYVKSPFVLVVDPALAAKTVAEFVELAKKSNPPLNFASIGTGSVQHMSMEFAKQRLGFEATHVPYRSTPQSVTDLMGGHVAASFLEAGLSMPLIRDGKLRALAVSSAQRLPLLPGVPPFAA